MPTLKSISQIIHSQRVNMGGNMIEQPLPSTSVEQVDPFLLIHHWDHVLPGGQHQSEVGVAPHPHRGFAPVTIIFQGAVHHRDSAGYDSVVHAGGTQWMNSGSGIIHSERPAQQLAESGGQFEFIQFWINAPAARKMDDAYYQALQAEDTPQVISDDGLSTVSVIAGEYHGTQSPIKTYSPVNIYRLDIQTGGEITLPNPATYNALIYLLDGGLQINNSTDARAKDMIIFDHDGDHIQIKGLNDTRAILLSGEPIKEPLATYGPFVMNSQRELMDAIQDFQAGKMGSLVEDFS